MDNVHVKRLWGQSKGDERKSELNGRKRTRNNEHLMGTTSRQSVVYVRVGSGTCIGVS